QSGGTDGTTAVVAFRLRQIERIFAFDIAGRDIIAECVADDFCIPINYEDEFRFGHTPTRVAPNSNFAIRSHHSPTSRFKEKLRPFGIVHPRIKHGSPAFVRFFPASFPAPFIRDASRPNLLSPD